MAKSRSKDTAVTSKDDKAVNAPSGDEAAAAKTGPEADPETAPKAADDSLSAGGGDSVAGADTGTASDAKDDLGQSDNLGQDDSSGTKPETEIGLDSTDASDPDAKADPVDAAAPTESTDDPATPGDDVDDMPGLSQVDAQPDVTPTPDTGEYDPSTRVIRETVIEKRAGFVPVVVGGLIAGLVGFGAGYFNDGGLPFMPRSPSEFETTTQARLAEQSESLQALSAQVTGNADALSGIDLDTLQTSLGARIDALENEAFENIAGLTQQLQALQTRLSEVDERLIAQEKEPLVEAVSPEVVAAYERELEALQATVAEQAASIESRIEEQRGFLDDQRAEVARMISQAQASEQNAEQQAALARGRAALSELRAALDAGRPYATQLGVVAEAGIEVPAPLPEAAEDGVPSQPELVEAWPAAARAALAGARAGDGPAEGFGAFLKAQLGARSVTPREGDDPDAVLSRAEAALRDGDLDTALNEIDALPDAARGELDAWVDQATLRRDALQATQVLAQRLNAE